MIKLYVNFNEYYMYFKYGMIFSRELPKRCLSVYNIYYARNVFNIRNFFSGKPNYSSSVPNRSKVNTTRNYLAALTVLALGGAYAAVPLYRIFCQSSGFGGTAQHDIGGEKIENMRKVPYRKITVKFTSDVSTNLKWKFKPQQKEIVTVPGETALAFYTATNPTDKPVIGISTYNVVPFEAGQYFNKIQCFCFEEQQLNPKEQVDMPVFFYIDPDFCEDPLMENVDEIVLSYTFFQAKEGMSLSMNNFYTPIEKK